MDIEIDIDQDDPHQLPSGYRIHPPQHVNPIQNLIHPHDYDQLSNQNLTENHQYLPIHQHHSTSIDVLQEEEDIHHLIPEEVEGEENQGGTSHHHHHSDNMTLSNQTSSYQLSTPTDEQYPTFNYDLTDEKTAYDPVDPYDHPELKLTDNQNSLDHGLDEFLLTAVNSPANPHWGPAPMGRALRRNRTRKRVALTDGHLVIDRPIPARLLGFLPRRGEEEFEMMSYTAATCDVSLEWVFFR